MSIRTFNFVKGEYYHVYNRGNSKQVIFHDKDDYGRFIELLYLCNTTKRIILREIQSPFLFKQDDQLVAIGAYCLMPNHFHILITEITEGGISKFMQKISTAYSMFYNKKYTRTGSLFEGKFKSQYIHEDRYLKYIYSYIHLNPIKLIDSKWKEDGIKDIKKSLEFLQKYQYSSYKEYNDLSYSGLPILQRESFPKYFSSTKNFSKEIIGWLSYKK